MNVGRSSSKSITAWSTGFRAWTCSPCSWTSTATRTCPSRGKTRREAEDVLSDIVGAREARRVPRASRASVETYLTETWLSTAARDGEAIDRRAVTTIRNVHTLLHRAFRDSGEVGSWIRNPAPPRPILRRLRVRRCRIGTRRRCGPSLSREGGPTLSLVACDRDGHTAREALVGAALVAGSVERRTSAGAERGSEGPGRRRSAVAPSNVRTATPRTTKGDADEGTRVPRPR